ncbi:phosphatase PAP2 family protein [Roseovarius faecimaris]|uniref:Phosphatase PAP2 family protein n=2 Tax=Roseovarius faecimaris TaxID=2494550 RepID=A0A6I6IVQ1_9RHOB|nr:phosphatase PAP2 family protein [Roseovarius faecimaris]
MAEDEGLVADARLAIHDALAGYWDPPAGNNSFDWEPDALDLDYLPSDRRIEVILPQILARFGIEQGSTDGVPHVTLKCDGAKICTIQKPSLSTLGTQMTWLRAYADLRADRAGEILLQAEEITSAFSAVRPFDLPKRRHTYEMLILVHEVTILLEQQIKHLMRSPRPVEFSDKVMPMIDTPPHSTYPSGHSTESFAIATALSQLEYGETPGESLAADRPTFHVAQRIAVNRTVAGVHYPVDSAAGAALGCAIGTAVAFIANGTPLRSFGFDPNAAPEADFNRAALEPVIKGRASSKSPDPLAILQKRWLKARGEWQRRDGRSGTTGTGS